MISKLIYYYKFSLLKKLLESTILVYSMIALSIISALSLAEYWEIINLINAPTFPYDLDYLISIIEGISYIVLTGFLVLLYKRQAETSESQKQVQQSQLEISQYEHAPELSITLLGGDVWAMDPYLEFELANEGKGPVQGFWASTDLEVKGKQPPSHLSGTSTFVNAAIPENSNIHDRIDFPQKIDPGDSVTQKIQFRLEVKDNKNQETVSGIGPDILLALSEVGVTSVYLRLEISARDIFRKEKNSITGSYRESYSMHVSIDKDMYQVLPHIQSYIESNSSSPP